MRAPGTHSPGINSSTATNTSDRKRKAGSSSSLYYGYSSQGSSMISSSAPSSFSMYHMGSPRHPATSTHANATQSLFTSILAPPSPKRARTIRNPNASPIPAPVLPQPPAHPASPSAKKGRARKGKEKDQGKDKGKAKAKHEGTTASARGRGAAARGGARAQTPSSTRSRSSVRTRADSEVANTNDDIKAAATLTEILFSKAGASPRSSLSAGSGPVPAIAELGSPSQHYAQSSTRTAAHHGPSLSQSSIGSTAMSHQRTLSNNSLGGTIAVEESDVRLRSDSASLTRSTTPTQSTTPRASRTADSEAADLMLLLANSPSPARPKAPTRDALSAYTGRVLFPNASAPTAFPGSLSASCDGLRRDGTDLSGDTTLRGDGSFSSLSLSRAPTMLSVSSTVPNSPRLSGEPIVTPPTPGAGDGKNLLAPGHLLPAPPSPSIPSLSATTAHGQLSSLSRSSAPSGSSLSQPLTPSASSFDMSDYINVSPAPPSTLSHSSVVGTPSRLRTSTTAASLSKDVAGRRLFEGESVGRKLRFGEVDGGVPGALGSGIDLVQT